MKITSFQPKTFQPKTRRGFTLVEVLVVILVILILVSILLPIVSKMMIAAKATDTQAFLVQLQGAIERYHQDFRAYPGPLTTDEIYAKAPGGMLPPVQLPGGAAFPQANQITAGENLVLGLLGGLRLDPAVPPPGYIFDKDLIGTGPRSLNPNMPKSTPSYFANSNLSIGHYKDDVAEADDSQIPEFLDRFANPMPILYLRARAGAPLVMPGGALHSSAGNVGQYELAQIISYSGAFTNAYPNQTLDSTAVPNPDARSIGMGKDLPEYNQGNGTIVSKKKIPRPYHGLRTMNPAAVLKPSTDVNYTMPFGAVPYFRDASGAATARQKDGFILISAGKDRVYGTDDDITNFGAVVP